LAAAAADVGTLSDIGLTWFVQISSEGRFGAARGWALEMRARSIDVRGASF
jgi:hypothetical protein